MGYGLSHHLECLTGEGSVLIVLFQLELILLVRFNFQSAIASTGQNPNPWPGLCEYSGLPPLLRLNGGRAAVTFASWRLGGYVLARLCRRWAWFREAFNPSC